MEQRILSVSNHDRDAAGMLYVYPVVSRRAGGVSVGINLNPNKACNWRCVYCQVPGLVRGRAPKIDLTVLESELREFLEQLIHGDYFERHMPEGARRLADIAISGDGESTGAKEFGDVVAVIARLRDALRLPPELPVRLITNGSYLGERRVREALKQLAAINGEVWFKIDGGSAADFARINDVHQAPARVSRNLAACAAVCPTWVQTCMLAIDGAGPNEAHIGAYLKLLEATGVGVLRGVLLYGVARASHQPEAPRLTALAAEELERIAERIRTIGLTVRVSP